MEYRAWITVPDLLLEQEGAWESVITHLEQERPEFGAVIGWLEDAAEFVLSTDAVDELAAARVMFDAVCDALQAHGLSCYPTSVEIVVAVDEQVADDGAPDRHDEARPAE